MDELAFEDSQCFTMKAPNVVADVVDNEVVAVNLETGTYFSLFQQSAWLWIGVTSGHPIGKLVEAIENQGPYSREDVCAFVMELLRHDLIEPLKAENSPVLATESLAKLPVAPFAPIGIEAHRELQDILLLDPVHDSDETGWPEAR